MIDAWRYVALARAPAPGICCLGVPLGAFFLAAAIGCGPASAKIAEAQLGTGVSLFEALNEGDTVYIVHGPQGGFHVFGSVRVKGIEPGDRMDLGSAKNPSTDFQVFRDAERIDAGVASFTLGLDPVPGTNFYEIIGRFVILNISSQAELDGLSIRVSVTVKDVNGQSAHDEKTLTAQTYTNQPL